MKRSIDDYLNKVLCGDTLIVLSEIPSNSIDLVVTSPPYNLGIQYKDWDDNLSWDEYYEWCGKWMRQIYRVLKPDGRFCLNHYLAAGSASKGKRYPLMELNRVANKVGYGFHGLAVWEDLTICNPTAWGSWISASSPYINSPYEGILFLYKDHWKKDKSGISTIGKKDFIHACTGNWNIGVDHLRLTPATFPEKLPQLCIELLTYKGDIVLDPFSGSGTTVVVAEKLERKWIGIELTQDYVDIAYKRLAAISDKYLDKDKNIGSVQKHLF